MAVRYIDRALAGALADQREAYRVGLEALERYARQTRGAPFLQLSETQPDLAAHRRGERHRHRRQRGLCRQLGAVLRARARPRDAGHVRRSATTAATRASSAGICSAIPACARWSRPPSRSCCRRPRACAVPPTTTRCSTRRSSMRSRPGATAMPTNLPGTDVVVIGLGAAGGVAVLPLADAGLNVVGLEAGTWLTNKDFAPDEIRNNVRDWPMAVQKCNREVPTHRVNAQAPTTRAAGHAMMNGVGGTTLHYWAQSWRLVALRLQDGQRDDEALRPLARARRAPPWRTGRSATTSSSRTTTASNTRSACRARPATSWARSTRAATSSRRRARAPIRCRRCAAPAISIA